VRFPALVAVAFVLGFGAVAAGRGAEVPPSESEALRAAADEKYAQREPAEAIKLYRKALKAAGQRCVPCQIGLAQAYNALDAHKNAVESAEAAIAAIAAGAEEEELLAVAWNQKAIAQFEAAGKDPDRLRVAEASFRRVFELAPEPMVRFNLGVVLLRQSRDPEGVAELEAFLRDAPQSARAKTARDLIEQPRRARESMLPSLELVTLAGDYVTDEDLAGKVVLIDFWGTWCAPCRAAIPSLKGLVERSSKSPLVVLSVSNDQDEAALRTFVAEHGMGWPQVWDRRQELVREMAVTGFPTYVLADHEGVVVFRYSGWSEAVEKAIQSELRRAVAKAKRAGVANAATSPGTSSP
jgi:thiol-disulfide isomerase/thioredoxin